VHRSQFSPSFFPDETNAPRSAKTVPIRNKNTRIAYYHAIGRFLTWWQRAGFQSLEDIEPITLAAYIEQHPSSPPTIKQHMAAIRMLFSWLTEKGTLAMNPAREVKTPKFSRSEGKTPAPPHQEVQRLLDSIDVTHLVGLRDRALLAVMAYTFARIGAVVSLTPQDYFQVGKRSLIRFREKGGKEKEIPVHHKIGGIPRCLSRSRQALGTACKSPFPVYSWQVARARDRRTLTQRRLGDAQVAAARCGTFNHLFQPLFSRRRHHQLLRKRWHSGGGPADSRSRR
jgi:site-specific recombinase XerD